MINKNVLDDIADNLGLTALQTQIMIELMKQGGQCTAPELHTIINNQMKINRTTINSSLEKLKSESHIIETVSENKIKIYSLTNSNPKDLIDKIKKPREHAYQSLENLLVKAKEESKQPIINPMTYYSLPNRKILMQYVKEFIETSEKYILIQGNSLFLDQIFPFIQAKVASSKIEIFIQITWSPKNESDVNKIYQKYISVLDENRVALPHIFYQEIFYNLFDSKTNVDSFQDPKQFIKYMTNIHFLQLLTDQASLVGVHFGEPDEEGGGHYTRDPFTTQIFYIIFFLIFESSTGNKIDRKIVKKILKDRISTNFVNLLSLKKEN